MRNTDEPGVDQASIDGVTVHLGDCRAPQSIVDARTVVRTRYHWTTREIALLREHYPAGGLPACLDYLPGRTSRAIYMQAGVLGLKSPQTKAPRRSWSASEHIDDVLRREWAKGGRGLVYRTAALVMRPASWVTGRAKALGLTTPRYKPLPWSPAEDAVLRKHEHKALKNIRLALKKAGFERTETAIKVQMKRTGVSTAIDGEREMNASQTAALLGVDSKTVSAWVERGLLTSKRRGGNGKAGEMHVIKPAALRQFIIDHPAHVDIRKVEKFWFIELLAGRG